MHVIFLAEGLPEGMDALEKSLDRRNFGHGACRLRTANLYDYQVPEKDKNAVMSLLHRKAQDRPCNTGLMYSFLHKFTPFKHKRLLTSINFFIKYFGWFLNLKPIEPPTKQVDTGVKIVACNIIPIALIPDNFRYNKATGQWEEWL